MVSFSGVPATHVKVQAIDPEQLDLSHKRVAVIGGTGGIGRALARFMADRGAAVAVVGRTFREGDTSRLRFISADLELMNEAKRVAGALEPEQLDVLVLTTGIMTAPTRQETAEGIERDLAVSYLSRLAILREVGDRIGRERRDTFVRPRVFVMGFPGTNQAGNVEDFNSEARYAAMPAHMNTVAGNEALVIDGARRYPRIGVYGLNPGLIKTNIRANYLGPGSLRHRLVEWLVGLLAISADEYARRITPILFAPDIEGISGIHFNQKGVPILPSEVMSESQVRRLMEVSETLLDRALTRSSAA